MGRAIPRVQNQLRATDHPKGRTFALWCVSEYSNIPPFIRPTSAEMWCALMVSGDMENWARGDMRNWTPSIYEEVVELSGLSEGSPQLDELRGDSTRTPAEVAEMLRRKDRGGGFRRKEGGEQW